MKYIDLTRGYRTKVSDCDYDMLMKYKWNLLNTGKKYAKTVYKYLGNRKCKEVTMHRMIMKAKNGQEVDHINGDGLDNRRSNLRICNRNQNCRNSKIPKNNTSGYKGVVFKDESWRKSKYMARIVVNSKSICLGHYKTAKEAGIAYNKAAKKYHKEFARLNIIKGDK